MLLFNEAKAVNISLPAFHYCLLQAKSALAIGTQPTSVKKLRHTSDCQIVRVFSC